MKGSSANNRIDGEALVEYPDGRVYLRKFKSGKKVSEKLIDGAI